jgi:dipeptidyl aminopeptidase/acylaminoacyl peptidase
MVVWSSAVTSQVARSDAPPAAGKSAATRPALVTTAPGPETRAAFLKLIDRPVVDLSAKAEPAAPDATDLSLVRVAFAYDSEAGVRVPGLLVKRADAPAGKRMPAVVVMHGTSGSKVGELGRLRQFARRGFVAVAIDGRYHGGRTTQPGTTEYTAAIAAAFAKADADATAGTHDAAAHDPAAHDAPSAAARRAFPLYFDTVWDARRLLDYLQTRDDVDPVRIGIVGISKGGIETFLTAAADERVAVAAPCIGVQSFAYGLATDGWKARVGTVKAGFDAAARGAGVSKPDAAFARRFYDRVIPGIYNRFDGPNMLAATAPRPLLVINGDSDDKTPLPGVRIAADAGQRAYAAAGAGEKFRLIVQPDTGHKVTDASSAEALAWFERWLKP